MEAELADDPHQAARISVNIQLWLEHASEQHGWGYGTGVSDLARVIRLPGSVNRKLPLKLRPCRVVAGTGKLVDWQALPAEPPEKPKSSKTSSGSTPPPTRTGTYVPLGTPSVLDALDLLTWEELLSPHGWTYVKNETSTGAELWLRPNGATSEYSIKCFEHACVVWSEAAGLPVGKDQRLSKARMWAHLNGHGFDLAAATKALTSGDHDLPGHVADAVYEAATAWMAAQAAKILLKPSLGTPFWCRPMTRKGLRGLIATVLAADESDRGRVSLWAARRLADQVRAGHLTERQAKGVIEGITAKLGGAG